MSTRTQEYILIKPNGNVTYFDWTLLGFRALKDSMRSGDYFFSVMSSSWYKLVVGGGTRCVTPVEVAEIPSQIKTICLLNDIPI